MTTFPAWFDLGFRALLAVALLLLIYWVAIQWLDWAVLRRHRYGRTKTPIRQWFAEPATSTCAKCGRTLWGRDQFDAWRAYAVHYESRHQ